ncbi:MAG: ferredoxin [Alphaproteobacteria bacterium]
MKIKVDMSLCELHGQCVFLASDVFSIEDDNLIYNAAPDEALRDKVEKAARACPQLAIKIED